MPEEKQDHFFTELLKFALIAAAIVIPVRLYVAQPFIVSGASMDPTFATGQYLIVDELSYHFEEPKRGEVVIFHYPKDPKQFFIKRIIGLPGETISVNGAEVRIVNAANPDGFVLDEPYLASENLGGPTGTEITLSDSEYFVLGDNRRVSSDSRVWGALPQENIIGHVLLRLFPFDMIGLTPGDSEFTR